MDFDKSRAHPAGPALKCLNYALHAAHLSVIGFSVTGWMFPATQPANLILLLLVLGSWYGLGPLLGKCSTDGYCVITDIHWRVRRHIGIDAPSWGYMKYLVDGISGRKVDEELIDRITALVFFSSLTASIFTTFLY